MLKYTANQKTQTILPIIVPAMRKLFFFVLFLAATMAHAADSIRIEMNTKKLNKGDTLEFKCTIPGFSELRLLNATLNVWIEKQKMEVPLSHNQWRSIGFAGHRR
jgi:hypothetical protein